MTRIPTPVIALLVIAGNVLVFWVAIRLTIVGA